MKKSYKAPQRKNKNQRDEEEESNATGAYIDKTEIILGIESAYKEALKIYNSGDLNSAEKALVKVIKPVLSKALIRDININDLYITDKIKEYLLNAMNILGEIYLKSDKFPNNYAKAAAIFQYCAGFAEKNKLEGSQDFKGKAYLVEKSFLDSIKNSSSELLGEDYYKTFKDYK